MVRAYPRKQAHVYNVSVFEHSRLRATSGLTILKYPLSLHAYSDICSEGEHKGSST